MKATVKETEERGMCRERVRCRRKVQMLRAYGDELANGEVAKVILRADEVRCRRALERLPLQETAKESHLPHADAPGLVFAEHVDILALPSAER
jgi:hypothetical protein